MVLGDAAHTMSPVGAQGLNVAIRDAVVAANHLVSALCGEVDPAGVDSATRAIEVERLPEVRDTQRFQALPPKVLFRNTWWARLLLRTVATFAGSSIARSRGGATFARFASGLTEVQVKV